MPTNCLEFGLEKPPAQSRCMPSQLVLPSRLRCQSSLVRRVSAGGQLDKASVAPMAPILPILKFEEKIAEVVDQNPVVVVIGETGSGKSTQLSQILHRRGYTKKGAIAVTQPRRVAAVSVSRRVAQELGVQLGEEVGYAIRFEDRTSERTVIKYLTDGCLLRESLSNPQLAQYSVIILDEAHERSLNTDILLGLMKRLIMTRATDLKVLITSATLDGVKVSNFFSECPVLNIPGTLFPVEKIFSEERPTSYIEASLKTALNIHTSEPPGDVLIFMTGMEDIDKMVSKLEDTVLSLEEGSCLDALILPLHGSLPPEMQVRVFGPAPPNCRRFIVATNIAETSLTVDGVVYVIDPGYVKQRQYNPSTGMYSLDIVQISRVQADQRAGRAGRTRPGKCYRLYPSTVYLKDFLDATVPEIQRTSLAGSVLYLKSLDLPDIDILKFDFLDPPSRDLLEDALRQLYLIDAIDEDGEITQVGRAMSVAVGALGVVIFIYPVTVVRYRPISSAVISLELPLEPSLSRTLIAANELECLSQALTVAAMLSAEANLHARRRNNEKKRQHPDPVLPDGSGWGDHIQLLQVYEAWHLVDYNLNWCNEFHVQVRSMKFAKDVRKQLSQIVQKVAKGPLDVDSGLITRKKHGTQYRSLRKALCKGYGYQLGERMLHHNGYRIIGYRSQLVQVHPSSVLQTDEDGVLPDYVVYHELISTPRPFMRNVCAVEMSWAIPILKKLEKLNTSRLSGGQGAATREPEKKLANITVDTTTKEIMTEVQEDVDSKIQAARERYLARKAKK